ncbi:MAG: hypothetical protein IKA87_03800, partial [Lentisphaeria bacterium]|nr:hypothetical protein [Lentisphaeria bacterium]
MRISDRNRQQRGAALLFALGILSLILVMGLAFLGNSLISQKLAFNSQESASAAALARSAVDRAMAHLTLFNLLQVNGSIATYIPDASSVFSRKTEGTINVANNKQARDQIHTGKSKFSVMRRFSKTAWYDGRNSLAEWIYIHEDGTESDGSGSSSSPIKGRFAYQVLPASSNSRLSLYAVTSGINALNGTAPDHADFSKSRVPHLHRWGVDVDELVI